MDSLLSLAHPRIYDVNAFRLTGLPVDATGRDVARHVEKQLVAQKLGVKNGAEAQIFGPSEPPTVDSIRAAAHQLKDPEVRLLHELFWLWPMPNATGTEDSAVEAIRQGNLGGAVQIWTRDERDTGNGIVGTHNLAVLYHCLALSWEAILPPVEQRDENAKRLDEYWEAGLTRWAELCRSDAFWGRVVTRIRTIDDPRLTTGVALSIRAALPTAICLVGAKTAVQVLGRSNKSRAEAIISMIRGAFSSSVTDKCFRTAAGPAQETIKALCGAAQDEVKRAAERGDQVTEKLLTESRRSLDTVDLLLKPGDPSRDAVFDQVALCGIDCMIPFANATKKWDLVVTVTEKLVGLAVGPTAQDRLKTNLETARGNREGARQESVFAPIVALMDGIMKELSPIRELSRLKAEVWPRVAALQQRNDVSREEFELLATRLGWAFRAVALELWNDLKSWAYASEALSLAAMLAFSDELRSKLRDDRIILDRNKPRSQCFIATAAFQSGSATEVETLRLYRDAVLTRSHSGRALVRVYYRLSPPIARVIEARPWAAAMTRRMLKPIVRRCEAVLDKRRVATGVSERQGAQRRAGHGG